MHKRTLLFLVVAVLVLGGLALWTNRQEAAEDQGERPLVPGLEREAIVALRVDNLERSLQMHLERDDEGVWRITDPLRDVADDALLTLLLDALTLNRAVPHAGELEDLALYPPRVVVEVEERGGGLRRVEVGAVDLDRQHVVVRIDGVVLRTLRNLDSTLERDLHEWRNKRILGVSPGSIIELHRRGSMPALAGLEPEDMTLDALQENGWRATAPFGAALAPETIGPLLSSLAYLRIEGFEDDSPGPLADYGLDPPELTIEVTTVQGETHTLLFSHAPGGDRLRCYLEGSGRVVTVAGESAAWLMAPAGMLVDRELVRAPRERMQLVRLAADGRETRVERVGFSWYVSATGGDEGEIPSGLADADAVSDLIGTLEEARILELLPGVAFPGTAATQGVYVEADGEVFGGEIGPPHASEKGTEGLLFRRAGDSLVGLVDPALLELARTDPAGLRSSVLHRVSELEVVQAKVAAPGIGTQRTWARNDAGRWTPEGSEAEARDFARFVDRLLTVRAVRFPDPDENLEGDGLLGVSLIDRTGTQRAAFTLELLAGNPEDPAAARVLYQSSEQRAVVDGRLYFPLLAAMAP